MKKVIYLDSPAGKLCIAESGGYITDIFFADERAMEAEEICTPVLEEAAAQLREYFQGKRKVFQLPIAPEGSPFRMKVWNALTKIPYGETRSYKQIAEAVGNAKACRAVGGANNKNPISIVVPCHRVIGADGSLTGYAGGTDKKSFLLELEKNNI